MSYSETLQILMLVATIKHGRKYTIYIVKVPNQVFKLPEVAEMPN